jgi:hypothetical protein
VVCRSVVCRLAGISAGKSVSSGGWGPRFVVAGVSFVVAGGRGCGVAGGGRCCVGGAGGVVSCCCGWRVGCVGLLVCGAVVLPRVGRAGGGAVVGRARGWVLSGGRCSGSRVVSLRRAASFFGDHNVSPRQIPVKQSNKGWHHYDGTQRTAWSTQRHYPRHGWEAKTAPHGAQWRRRLIGATELPVERRLCLALRGGLGSG